MNDLTDDQALKMAAKLAQPEPRTCANCACHLIAKHPTLLNENQMFCRRNGVLSMPARVDRVRLDEHGKPVISKRDGKPVMESVQQLVYLYQPTKASETCFDGWRPMDTPPGDFSYKNADLDKKMFEIARSLQSDLMRTSAPTPRIVNEMSLAKGQCVHGVPAAAICDECAIEVAKHQH